MHCIGAAKNEDNTALAPAKRDSETKVLWIQILKWPTAAAK
jgi:hypothetical protein